MTFDKEAARALAGYVSLPFETDSYARLKHADQLSKDRAVALAAALAHIDAQDTRIAELEAAFKGVMREPWLQGSWDEAHRVLAKS